MPKILIFGLGSIFHEHVAQINMDEVVGLADNSLNYVRGRLYGKYCFSADRIGECDFDYAVIFNQAHSREIHDQLVEQGVPPEKIISWQYYMYCMAGRSKLPEKAAPMGNTVPTDHAVPMSRPCLPHIADFIRVHGIQSVLDVDGSLAANGFRNATDLSGPVDIENLSGRPSLWGRGLYSRTEADALDGRWDALVCLDYFLSHCPGELAALVRRLDGRIRHLVVSSPFPYPEQFTEWADFDFSSFGTVHSVSCRTVMLHFIDVLPAGELKLVTVAHKTCVLPDSPLYLPVFAGGDSGNPLGIQGDAEGDNISNLNPKINELTALYWAWKNTDYAFLGLCHYRRYFSNGQAADNPFASLMDTNQMLDALLGCDMVVSSPVEFWPETVVGQLALTIRKDALETGLLLVRGILAERHPDYLSDFDEYLGGHWMYPCNMFVARRELVDRYCSWLFDIIIPAAERIDVSDYDGYSARIIGFIAERLLTLWILHNGLKVKELPVVMIEPYQKLRNDEAGINQLTNQNELLRESHGEESILGLLSAILLWKSPHESGGDVMHCVDTERFESGILDIQGWAFLGNDDCFVVLETCGSISTGAVIDRPDVKAAFGLDGSRKGFGFSVKSDDGKYRLYLIDMTKCEAFLLVEHDLAAGTNSSAQPSVL